MNIEELRDYCLAKKAVEETMPFDDKTLVFKVLGKMYALVGLERMPVSINLKCDPERAVELREAHPDDILPGYHMNKKHWNSVVSEQGLSGQLIRELIDHSYDLVVSKMTKKDQEALRNAK